MKLNIKEIKYITRQKHAVQSFSLVIEALKLFAN